MRPLKRCQRSVSFSWFLIFFWTFLLLFGEWFLFEWTWIQPHFNESNRNWFQTEWQCRWPDVSRGPFEPRSGVEMGNESNENDSNHFDSNYDSNNVEYFAILADPQLTDFYSYHQSPILLALTEFYSDLYLKRIFHSLQRFLLLYQAGLLFLGDLMDGGREWIGSQSFRFHHSYQRWLNLFASPLIKNILYHPGNHDVGWGNEIPRETLTRFNQSFHSIYQGREVNSSLDYFLEIGTNCRLVFLNTLTLKSHQSEHTEQVLAQLTLLQRNQPKPLILISHVPLFRPAPLSCGPLRSVAPFGFSHGYQYQTMIEPEQTERLLSQLKPSLILSGDDHFPCTVWHSNNSISNPNPSSNPSSDPSSRSWLGAVEHSVGTVSWLQGNPQPSLGLLAIHKTTGNIGFHFCALPHQWHIYGMYCFAFLGTIIAIAVYSKRKKILFIKIFLFVLLRVLLVYGILLII